MDSRQTQADLLSLLNDSPIASEVTKGYVTEYVYVGEIGLALEIICSHIYENYLPVTEEFFARLFDVAERLELQLLIEGIRDLIVTVDG